MSSTQNPTQVNTFVIDAFCISMELHAVSERDAPGSRAAVIRKGRQSYRTLIKRLEALYLSAEDASTTESILKIIEARLQYLHSISSFRRNQWRWRREQSMG